MQLIKNRLSESKMRTKMDSPLNIKRYEIKYYIALERLPQVRKYFAPYVTLDPFSEMRQDKNYIVRSIYFDSSELDFYYEKIDGLKIRKKLRVRTYNEQDSIDIAFLEIKRRYEKVIYKERLKIPLDLIEMICIDRKKPNGEITFKELQCSYGNNGFANSRVIDRFLYNLDHKNLKPTLLVTYEREAYVGIIDQNVRVTFDKNVRTKIFPTIDEVFAEDDLTDVTNDVAILELKFNNFMPTWLRKATYHLNIQAQSISKYCMGIAAASLLNDNKGIN